MIIAKFFDKNNSFVEVLNVENISWTRQKNKEYTFDINLAEIPNSTNYIVRLIDTEQLLRVLPSGYISKTDGSRKISIKSWENMLSDVGQIIENWQGWDGKNIQQVIPDLCYGFRKVGFATLSDLQSYVSADHIQISELDDSNGDVFLDTFEYFNPHELAYYESGFVIYRIAVPAEARRQGMKLRWMDSVGDTTDISVQFRWSNTSNDWVGAFSTEQSPTRSESITPNQTVGVDIPESSLSYLFVRLNLKYDAGTSGVNYEQQITTVQGSTSNIVYYGCTPRLNAFEVVYRVNTMISPGVVSVTSKLLTADIHDKGTLLDVLKVLAEDGDFVFYCSVEDNGSILLNASSLYVTDMTSQIGCISDYVNANILSKDRELDYFDACNCYGSGSGIDRLHVFITLPGVTEPKNITTFENDEIHTVAELITAGEAFLESENEANTIVKFGWYGDPVLQIHDRAKILVGDIIYEDNITEESFTFDQHGLSRREYIIGIKTYPLRSVLGGSLKPGQLPIVQSPTNVTTKRANDGMIVSWNSTSKSFIVEYKRSSQTWWLRKIATSNSTVIPIVENNTIYTFRIYAIEGASTSAPASTIADSGISDIDKSIDGDSTMKPDSPTSVLAVASQETVDVSWQWSGVGIQNKLERFRIELSKDNRATWASYYSTANSFRYTFNRDTDGYPSTTDLGTWFVRVKAENIYGNESDVYAPGATGQGLVFSNYKGWIPAIPSRSTRSNGRGVTILWGSSIPVFGERLYDIQIAKGYTVVDGVLTLITNPADLVWYAPAAGINPKLSYENYKEGPVNGFISRSGNNFSMALPLYGQNETPQFAEDTPYYIRMRASSDVPTTALPNNRNLSDWSTADLIYAYGSSAQDIVENAILNSHITDDAVTARNISVAILSAISANIGVITDGAMVGNENNMWAISTVYEEDGITPKYYSGTLKAGGSNQYLHITPRLAGGVQTGEYDIDFKVGNFTVTAIGSTINGIFEIRNIADNVVYFSVDPSKYGVTKIRNSLEIGNPTTASDRETIKEGYAIYDLVFTGAGSNDMEIVQEGTIDADLEVKIHLTEGILLSDSRIWGSSCSDPSGNIWACASGKIYKCNAGTTTFNVTTSLDLSWGGITSDPSGNIWACASGGKIYKCNAGTTTFNVTTSLDLMWGGITSDPSGNIWALTNYYIYKCNVGTTTFNVIPSTQLYIESICSDKSGNIWIGGAGGKIYKINNGTTLITLDKTIGESWSYIISDTSGNVFAFSGSSTVRHGMIYVRFDSFIWKISSGSYHVPKAINQSTQYELTGYGTKIQFSSQFGHILNDLWTFSQGLLGGLSVQDVDGVEYFSVKDHVITGVTKAMVGLGSVDNTADSAKPVSTPQQTALNLKANLNAPIFTGDAKAVTPEAGDNDTSIATSAFVQSALNESRSIAESATLTALNRFVLVKTANAITITLPASLAVGKKYFIERVVASENAITLARSGTDTIEGGTSFVSYSNRIEITMVSSTNFEVANVDDTQNEIIITASVTLNPHTSRVIVNTANAVTITIPENIRLFREIVIERIVLSTNGITVARSGSTETIEGAATYISYGNTIRLLKATTTAIEVANFDEYENEMVITASATINARTKRVIVNTANAVTITIPSGMRLFHKLQIKRIVASTNAVTLARSGTETIEGATTFITHAATTISELNLQVVELSKNEISAWTIERYGSMFSSSVDGVVSKLIGQVGAGIIESGYVSGSGWYIKFSDGTMIQLTWLDLPGQAISTSVSSDRNWPTPFYSIFTKISSGARQIGAGSQVMVGAQAYNGVYTQGNTNVATLISYAYRVATENGSDYVRYDVLGIGRWKA